MKVQNEITIFEIDGGTTKASDKNKMIVESVWNSSTLVSIKFGDKLLSVSASELRRAIQNSMNKE